MGKRMSARLVDAGYKVAVFDVNAEAVADLVGRGATAASSPGEAAADADFIMTSLPSAKIIEAVYLGDDGVLSTARNGAVAIDFSTVDPATARKVNSRAAAAGVSFLDAPVSRGTAGAESGTLAIMVGGTPEAFKKAEPVLANLGTSITLVGDSGAGAMVKLCNNMISAIITAATAEVLVAGREVGLDTRTMQSVLSNSSAASHMLTDYFPRVVFGETRPVGFTLDLMMKDIDLFLDAAGAGRTPLFVSSAVRQAYRLAQSQGFGARDSCHITELYEDAAQQELRY